MRYLFSIFFVLVLTGHMTGQDFPKPMVPYRLVNDFTNLLNENEQVLLNSKLLTFNNETSTQIYVVTYDDLQGFDIADYGDRLAENWGIGQQGKNNGILVLVSPVARKISIRTGYGLEGVVPDAIASRLINNVVTPAFKQAQYYNGLDSATNVLMALTRGEFTAEDYLKRKSGDAPGSIVFGLLVLFIILMVFLSNMRKNKHYSPGRSLPWWLLAAGMSSRNSGWGSFSSGSGSFGGGGGGGFGGFGGGGGGSFGGGGASGGW